MKLNSLGMIKDGVCERIFRQRELREQGARLAWNWLEKHNCVKIRNGWYKIIKLPQKIFAFQYVINTCHDGDIEIGWRRFTNDIAKQLYKNHRKFRLAWMQKWIAGIAALEFGARSKGGESLTAAHAFGAGPTKTILGYAKPHRPQLYDQYKAPKGV